MVHKRDNCLTPNSLSYCYKRVPLNKKADENLYKGTSFLLPNAPARS